MAKDDTARELDKLRADVAALTAARKEDAARAAETPPADPAPAEQARVAAAPTTGESLPEEQRSQLEELGELLQQEIRDLPTITSLAVFSLGILMGRLMR